MTDGEVLKQLEAILKETISDKDKPLQYDVNIQEAYDIDSVDLSRILYDIEKFFEISFSPREISQLETLNDYSELILKKINS